MLDLNRILAVDIEIISMVLRPYVARWAALTRNQRHFLNGYSGLGVHQRLKGGSLQESLGAFFEKIKSQESVFLVSRLGKKFREGEVSLATGGLSRTRDRLPESLVEELYETATKNIEKKYKYSN